MQIHFKRVNIHDLRYQRSSTCKREWLIDESVEETKKNRLFISKFKFLVSCVFSCGHSTEVVLMQCISVYWINLRFLCRNNRYIVNNQFFLVSFAWLRICVCEMNWNDLHQNEKKKSKNELNWLAAKYFDAILILEYLYLSCKFVLLSLNFIEHPN